jgi:hypothetical protein
MGCVLQFELLIGILSVLVPILSSIAYLGYWLGKKFSEIDERFKLIDERFKHIDERFELIEERFKQIDARFDELKSYVDRRIERLGRAFTSYQEFLIEYLSVKGVVSEGEATMLKNEARRVTEMAVLNPFTKEEWKRLIKYLDKDIKDFTLQEAEDFRELARKAIDEFWDRPEAYKLHMYACIVYGLTLRRLQEEKEKKRQAQERREQ